jgi:hypothetical protein
MHVRHPLQRKSRFFDLEWVELSSQMTTILDIIGWVVPFGVLMIIDLIITLQSMAFCKFREHWRAMQRFNVIVKSHHLKKGAKSISYNLPQL